MKGPAHAHDEQFLPLPGGGKIPRSELRFEYSRSSGPGGQNVNKVSTRVSLCFDLDDSSSLSPFQKQKLREKLAGRISADGVLRVVSSKHRSQSANREAAIERFAELLIEALTPAKRRLKTRVPARAWAVRLNTKARKSDTKRLRRHPAGDE